MPSIAFGLMMTLIAQIPAPGEGAAAKAETLRQARKAIEIEETAALDDLAGREVKAGRAEDAARVRALIVPPAPKEGPIRIVLLPEIVSPIRIDPARPGSWQAEAQAIRGRSAEALLRLAARAASEGVSRLALADECLRSAIARVPNHREARRLLGYEPFEGGWATPGAIARRKGGQVFDPVFGWVPGDWIPNLAQGLLPDRIPGRPWLKAAEADAQRSEISKGWQIKSAPHFRIQADVPLSEAIAFGGRLEALQDVFLALFADVLGPMKAPIALRFRDKPGKPSPDNLGPFEVFYFAGKDEYVQYLARNQGRDEKVSLGLYLPPGLVRGAPKKGRSFFYRDPGGKLDATATLYHEGSHQILFESVKSSNAYNNNKGHYWVWEGLGTYFETLTPTHDGAVEIGGLVGPRFASARPWLIDAQRFVPTAKLTGMDQDDFKKAGNEAITVFYVESIALTLYLMNAEGGKYRDPFIGYVADGAAGKLRSPKDLENRLGVAFRTLDQQFLDWLDRVTKKP